MRRPRPTGDELICILAALANPRRMRVFAALSRQKMYVSALARELGMSRSLLQAHLQRLEVAGLVRAEMQMSEHGKALNYYEVIPFDLRLNVSVVAEAARFLGRDMEGPWE